MGLLPGEEAQLRGPCQTLGGHECRNDIQHADDSWLGGRIFCLTRHTGNNLRLAMRCVGEIENRNQERGWSLQVDLDNVILSSPKGAVRSKVR